MSASQFRCSNCKELYAKSFSQCAICKKWTTCVQIKGERMLKAVGPVMIRDITGGEKHHRITTGTDEFDRVLAGGAVMGSVILVAGPPGEGKSTLLLQMGCELADAPIEPQKVLYISGEETVEQIKSRGTRICPEMTSILLCNETNIEKIIEYLIAHDPDVAIVDSIQTVQDESIGTSNTIQQLHECTKKLVAFAKSREMTLFIIAQLNKEGGIAGPRSVEHLVDTVLEFGSEEGSDLRVLRASKNRFGDTGEVGVFRMIGGGLESVSDPSALLLRGKKAPPGSALSCVMIAPGAGNAKRAMIVEVQALVTLCGEGVKAKRVCTGYSEKRLEMLLAVVAKFCGEEKAHLLPNCDIYLNVAGGLKVESEGLDLPVVMAMVSSLYDAPLPPGSVFWGEMGLLGEIRPEKETRKRITVCETMGLKGHVCSTSDGLVRIEDVVQIIAPSPAGRLDALPPPLRVSGSPSDGRQRGEGEKS